MNARHPTAYCIVVVLPFVLAGCLGGGTGTDATDRPLPTPTDAPSTWQTATAETTASMPYQYCVVITPGTCTGGSIGEGDWAGFLPMGRDARKLVVELTWTPTSPLTEEIRAYAAPSKPCGEMCFELVGPVANATGPSPLRIVYPEPLEDARDVAFWLRPVDLAPGDPHVEAGTEQPVHVRITWEEPA